MMRLKNSHLLGTPFMLVIICTFNLLITIIVGVTTQTVGTDGKLAPCYGMESELTDPVDYLHHTVYSLEYKPEESIQPVTWPTGDIN